MEPSQYFIPEADARTRDHELGCRSAVQGKFPLWRVEAEQGSGWSNLEHIQQSNSGSLSQGNAQCPLFFFLKDQSAPLGIDALVHEWPHTIQYMFPLIALISPDLHRVRDEGLKMILSGGQGNIGWWRSYICCMQSHGPCRCHRWEGGDFHPHP